MKGARRADVCKCNWNQALQFQPYSLFISASVKFSFSQLMGFPPVGKRWGSLQPPTSQPPSQRRTDWHTKLECKFRSPKKGSDGPAWVMCQPLGQSPVATGSEDYSFRALVSNQSMAGGGRNPLRGQSGRDLKEGWKLSSWEGLLGTVAFISSWEKGKFARKPHWEEASWPLAEDWGLSQLWPFWHLLQMLAIIPPAVHEQL